MNEKKGFIGRDKELKEFQEFLAGERPNWEGIGRGAPLLIVEGDEGMGKMSLLQEMAARASTQRHKVFCRDILYEGDFALGIYSLIAMVKAAEPDKLGALTHWKELAFIVGKFVCPRIEGVKDLLDLRQKIKEEHNRARCDEYHLARLFVDALSEFDGNIGEDQRIIILLYPPMESPAWLVPFLDLIRERVPPKVRFVIAQRPRDLVIEAAEKMKPRKLRELCAEPMRIGPLEEDEIREFLDLYDTSKSLTAETREAFQKLYGGWPYLMELGLKELQKIQGAITREAVGSLPPNIETFWKNRYEEVKDKQQRIFLQTTNLLAHPYRSDDVALFAGIDPDDMDLACDSDSLIWGLLKREDYDEPISGKIWKACPIPKHPTERKYVVDRVKSDPSIFKRRSARIVSEYKKRMGAMDSQSITQNDATRHLLGQMIAGKLWDDIEKLLTDVKYLKARREPEEEYSFQNDFAKLVRKAPIHRLRGILKRIFDTICGELGTSQEKADWLDTFAYWINEFGAKPEEDEFRKPELKNIANDFDRECGKFSRELAEDYFRKGDSDWAFRFAELYTWVYQRAGDYEACVQACGFAEEKCRTQTQEEAYRLLGRAEFIRMRALALRKLAKDARKGGEDRKGAGYENAATEAYKELKNNFPVKEKTRDWPTMEDWEKVEEILDKDESRVLTPPSILSPAGRIAFNARVISNLDDCIGAMHVIHFFERHDGQVEWIHHQDFEYEQFNKGDPLFTVLIGGPKAPGISRVAHRFYEATEKNRERFFHMYSGLHPRAYRLNTMAGKTHCYMLGGISKLNTLRAAYDFTEYTEVKEILESV